ncbi:MAG: NAD(P)-dependent oxidoreductase [Ignavibacteria bacterium]|nr:NAD(P)-dependent oxidoreductase [Ignavibacteria bacterium]
MKSKDKISILVADDLKIKNNNILSESQYAIEIKTGISNEEILLLREDYKVLIIKSQRKLNKLFLSRCSFDTICTASKGFDHIDTDYAKKRGIRIINSENGNYIAAAEHTFALILDIFKNTHLSDNLVRSGKFDFWNFKRQNLYGKKIGIIGTGKVGTKVAELSKAFGMEVLANETDTMVMTKNKFLDYYNLDKVLRDSDIITLHIPYNKANDKFIDRRKFLLMKKNAVFINTSRGGVIDEKALITVLKSRKKFRAGLDVFEKEPYINKELKKLNNVILTNHIAGKTLESADNIINEILIQVKKIDEKISIY